MPAKGETYNVVDVDLARWVKDKLKEGKNQGDLHRLLRLDRSRISEMAHGRVNTKKYLRIVVERGEAGNWNALLPYATSREGRAYIEAQALQSRMSKKEQKLYRRALDELQKAAREGRLEDFIKR